MHSTNKAFERYFRIETDEVREVYEFARGGPPVGHQNRPIEKAKVLKIKE